MTTFAQRLTPAFPTAIAITIAALLAINLAIACTTPEPTPPPSTNTPVPATTTPISPADTPAAMPASTSTPTPAPDPAGSAANTRIADFPTPTADTPAAAPDPTPSPTSTPAPAATATPTAEPESDADAVGWPAVFTLAEGSIARYQVEEVLARTGFFIATGETTAVAGQIAFDADGGIVADASRIAVQAATLSTDSSRRDGYVRNRTLLTDTYPEVVFIPQSIQWATPPQGELTGEQDFAISGDLTIRDQTRPVTWDGNAAFGADGSVAGSASVQFTFDDFGMDKPSVAIVLSVEDEILLELDFVGTMAPP